MLSGDTLYCKLEKKKKHPEESPYTALGAPCKQAVFTNQAFNENADPDHVYSNTADENGGHDNAFDENADPGHIYSNAADENGGHDNNGNSSVHANLESGLSCPSVVYLSVCLVSTAMTAVPPFTPIWNEVCLLLQLPTCLSV